MQTAYLYFPGCKLTPFLPQYDRATRAVLGAFGIRLDDTELNCCGYPVRNQNLAASVLAAARNLAIADRTGLPLLTPCQCCYGSLKQAAYWLGERPDLRTFVNHKLAVEGLHWRPIARPGVPDHAASAETSISGADVANPTIVSPTSTGETPKFRAVAEAPTMKRSPPQASKARPTKIAPEVSSIGGVSRGVQIILASVGADRPGLARWSAELD